MIIIVIKRLINLKKDKENEYICYNNFIRKVIFYK